MAGSDREHVAQDREPEVVRAAAARRYNFSPWNLLLLIPVIGVLIPGVYNRTEPTLAGWPFFYWFQMVAIPVSVLITIVVYRATRGDR
jgi:hypothetical protein